MENLPDGWLKDDAAEFLRELVSATDDLPGDFLEIGSWHGRSSVVIGSEVQKLGGRLYCIDTWNTKSWDEIARTLPKDRRKFIWEKGKEPFKVFIANIRAAGLVSVITPLVGSSKSHRAAWTIPLKFIFVDGCHYYEFVRDDAKWREHLIAGGIIAFHDYTNMRWEGVRAAVDEEMDADDRFEEINAAQSIKAFKCIGGKE